MTDCLGLMQHTEAEVRACLGPPASRREIDGNLWLIFSSQRVTFRVRCRDIGDGFRCASWTASFPQGFDTLAEIASAVGLWPAAQPDESARSVNAPMVRRALPCPERSLNFSLTATIRDRLFTQIAVFDEAPDWL